MEFFWSIPRGLRYYHSVASYMYAHAFGTCHEEGLCPSVYKSKGRLREGLVIQRMSLERATRPSA